MPATPARRHRTRLAAGLLGGVLLFAACGKSSSPDAATTTSAAETTTTVATTTTEATTTTTEAETTTTAASGDGLDALKQKAQGALLTPTDVGEGFTEGEYTASDTDTPCGTPDPDKALPAAITVGTELDHSTVSAALEEEIRIYQDETEAKAAYVTFVAALDCTSGKLANADGTTSDVTLGESNDVAGLNDNISEGYAKELKSADFEGFAVVARTGAAIITLQFANAPSADTTSLPDPQDVVDTAVTKAAAA